MRTRTLPLLLAAVLAGAAVALALALALPRAGTGAGAGAGAARGSASSADPARPALAPAWSEPVGGGDVRLQATEPPRIEARAADAAGGPPWAIRAFAAQRRANISRAPVGKPSVCAQLGRIVDGRFGWIDAANRFRPARVSLFDAPTICGVRPFEPQLLSFSTISDPRRGEPAARSRVTWGLAGAPATLTARVDGRRVLVAPTPHGVLLDVRRDDGDVADARLRVRYRDGRAQSRVGNVSPLPRAGLPRRGRAAERPRHGVQPQIDLRLPDPNGGQPWAIAVVPAHGGGGWCLGGLGQVVGDRVGSIDERLGTFSDGWPPTDCRRSGGRVVTFSFGFNAAGGLDPQLFPGSYATLDRGRVTRRTLRGQTTISGTARPDVVAVTIATPRDVRTLVPSPRARAFAAIYDGDFPSGELRISARLRDGTVHRERPFTLGF